MFCTAVALRQLASLARSDRRRVVVTGQGLITCLGIGAEHVWKKMLEGRSGISSIDGKGFENIPCQVAGSVPRGDNPGELNLESHIPPSELRNLPLAAAYGLIAAEEALSMAGWKPQDITDLERTGVAVGQGMVSLEEITDAGVALRERGHRRVNPFFIPKILINMPAGHISIKYKFQGPNHSVSTACTTGVHAIGDAFRFIQRGDADVMVAGGTEACIGPLAVSGFARMRALSTNFNKTPEKASRPFDKDRDGFVMSEGAGIVVLEELEHAKARSAQIYAEILGYGLSGDAQHITAPDENGNGARLCMQATIRDAGIDCSDVGYINAHATSTPLGDRAESRAIVNVFGEFSKSLYVSSTKGAVGHLLGAAGSVETIFCILACQHGQIPPTVNLDDSDTGCDLNYVLKRSVSWDRNSERRIAISNSFGFGGTNASLCVGEYVD
ncbi:3-oxoacyl-[acyl-carrier-protein] synthase, mitochondrial-like [Gigantopelta aegis]|uniref:3-oxoacyl-[acyl-carrier-protein] synthase, mitochondrial-like n=1 Tax=Gigantopelta aegis TaxID=1735272 RepID=UPI001B88CEF6|nr:3-oxoacyl-[acyl-carrier-protein] synthase, mitochondrial-like [Gigantopelta aegis]